MDLRNTGSLKYSLTGGSSSVASVNILSRRSSNSLESNDLGHIENGAHRLP